MAKQREQGTPTYSYRPNGVRVPGRSADEVYAELERIRRANPKESLSPPEVVEASRPEDAPLHSGIEWDDGVAAQQYRNGQVRGIIRSVYVSYASNTDPATEPVPSFVHIEPLNYQPVSVVVERPDLFEIALTSLHERVASAERAVRELEHAARAGGNPDRLASIGLAIAAFDTVRSALAALR